MITRRNSGLKDIHGNEILAGHIVRGVAGKIKDCGQSEVFFGDNDELQPMHYLACFDGACYEIVGDNYTE